MSLRLLLCDPLHQAGLHLLQQDAGLYISGPYANRQAMLEDLPEADAILVCPGTPVDTSLLDRAPRLRLVACTGSEIHHIDLDEATRRGILVINQPESGLTAVAEHTFALLLGLARRLPLAHQHVQQRLRSSPSLAGFELSGRTLGLIGFGRIGAEVALRAQAFGMKILAYDPHIDLALAHAQGVEVANLDELLQRADVITLLIPYSPETHHLLDAAALELARPGAILVNCAHASLVDQPALLAALQNGRLAGAALDALEELPLPVDHPWLQLENVVLTPRVSRQTLENQARTAQAVARDMLDALHQRDYRNVINLPFTQNLPYLSAQPYLNLALKLGKLQGQLAEGRIHRLEVELLGEGLRDLVRPVTAVLLSGMLRPMDQRTPNWISAPVIAHEQGIHMSQAKGLVHLQDYPNLIACRIHWQGENGPGQRTVAGVLFGSGQARLVQYDEFTVDAYPDGYVLILENMDIPGVIGKVGTRLGQAKINIAQWRYGRERRGGQAVSFINLDDYVPMKILKELETEDEIFRARLVRL